MFDVRPIKDPYEGVGYDFGITVGARRFSIVPTIGVSENLLEVQVSATPPFDTHKVNTLGEEDSPSWFKRLGFKVAFLYITLNVDFYYM